MLLKARANEEIAHAFEAMRDQQWSRDRLRLTYGTRVVDGDLAGVRRMTRAGGFSELEFTLGNVRAPQTGGMRAGTSGMSPDELVEAGVKRLFFGEDLPASLGGGFEFLASPGIDEANLRQAFDLPNETVEAITRLVVTEGLIGATLEVLTAVVVYHLLGEGVIARTAQNLAADKYERLAFPGLAEGQRLVARDEARHIGIGVSYARRRMETEPERARQVIQGVVEELVAMAGAMLDAANTRMADLVAAGYGVDPQGLYDEAMRLTRLRLRSIGLLDE